MPFAGMAMAVALQPERRTVEKKPDVKQRRVVITGMGVVTPLGHDPDVFYNNLLDGVSGISEIERFDCSTFPTVIQMVFFLSWIWGHEYFHAAVDMLNSSTENCRRDKILFY